MRFVTRFFAVIGVLVVIGALVGGFMVLRLRHTQTPLPDKALLTLGIDGELEEKPGFDPFRMDHQMAMGEALRALHAAAADNRIKGLFLTISDNLPLTQAQELHDAIRDFRQSGKPVYAFADTFGEQGPGAAEYYLATSASKVYLQPLGTVGLVGIAADEFFLKDALARIGVQFQVDKREQYKTAFDNFSEAGFTAANREMTTALLTDIVDQICAGVAADRKLDPAKVRKMMDNGPIEADDAKDAGLVDAIDYRDQALDDMQQQTDTDDTVSIKRYLNAQSQPDNKDKIAIIYAEGELSRKGGASPLDPLSDSQASDPRDVVAAFRQAADDDDVKAIVFRVNSPGGSVVASETIRSGLLIAENAEKPVVASMGEVAGSGGYWILADADRIVAEPATLTGSIGVLGGKPVVDKLVHDHGVATQAIEIGKNANMDSIFKPLTSSQQEKQDEMLDTIYDSFKEIVSDGRNLAPDKVEALAKGRVYTGRQAKALGLVDDLGGIDTAVAKAKELAGLGGQTIEVEQIPAEPGLIELLRSTLFHSGDDDEDDSRMPGRLVIGRTQAIARLLQPYLHALMQGPADRAVLMPDMAVTRP